jgi:hypothetical protein
MEDDITARMNAFKHRTESLLENARKAGGEGQSDAQLNEEPPVRRSFK